MTGAAWAWPSRSGFRSVSSGSSSFRSSRSCPATAGTGSHAPGGLPCSASWSWASRRAGHSGAICRERSPTRPGSTSTTARSEQSSSSTARHRPEALAAAGERLGEVRAPALIVWSTNDPYLPAAFAERHADALGGEATVELVDGGHWPWHERPELVERAGACLRAER